jgi:acyl carrier protein
MAPIEQELRAFVVENFLFGQDGNLRNDDSFLENGIIDSTGILELVSYLEEQYKIEVADQELVPENLDSINNLAGFLSKKLALPAQASALVAHEGWRSAANIP